MSLFAFPATLTNVILPLWFNSYSLNALGPAFSVCLVGFVSYAIVRHQFLDIKVIIQRGLIYTLTLSMIVSVYIMLIFTTEYLLNFGEQGVFLSAFITTLIGIFGVPPLTVFFKKISDPFFFKNSYDYAQTIKELTDTINATLSREKIVEQSTQTLTRTIKPTHVTFAFSENEKVDGVITLPITSNGEILGTLILGGKRSGDHYTESDISLLETFTSLAGTALEKAKLYSQVEEYAKNLENKVDARTKEVIRVQKEKESLMAEISHGLQTPLTIMKGEVFLLKKAGVPQESLKIFDASVDRVSSFINRLLSLSKVENSSKDMWSTFDLGLLLETVASLFKQTAEKCGITLLSSHHGHVPFFGNKDEIDELISNILSNAIKYIGNKSEKVVSLTSTINHNTVTITVTDSGIGLQKEDISHLFKKFSRIKSEATKGVTGTGLGLAICEKIAHKHGGTVAVESVYGTGSTFTIQLPLQVK
jgi:signal transduction histidine kinase